MRSWTEGTSADFWWILCKGVRRLKPTGGPRCAGRNDSKAVAITPTPWWSLVISKVASNAGTAASAVVRCILRPIPAALSLPRFRLIRKSYDKLLHRGYRRRDERYGIMKHSSTC